ncbi:RluA family pseudouridine synthase [Microlunatus soli]|uniref:RNA pseudouridylate synthase n=1 Tax=Microlunatus soli TaxID=630515 RepID=A0A1H1QUR9_9ACTN|nr:RluA family pseudouridine synthase [Microlunatus soli]SDS27272.1 tRNA pseudouridine32 synthase / 23S rRNA pseudouridine746 synthase [Microlunatus soli]
MVDWTTVRDHRVVYGDDHLLVIDKPAGIALIGERNDTDLMQQAREVGDFVMPAHRIDKVTSGLVLLARDQQTHGVLTRQFADRTVIKEYLAVVRGTGLADTGRIDLPLSVGRKNRVRIAAARDAIIESASGHWTVPEDAVLSGRHYPASTDFRTVGEQNDHAALLLRPHTGRRHQLRVQLAWIGHPIEGDPLFCKPPGERTHLHAWRLTFSHPASGESITVRADPDHAFWQPLGGLVPSLDAQLGEGA